MTLFGKWFFRFYWVVPVVAGTYFNIILHGPQVWSLVTWSIVTGGCLLAMVMFGELHKPKVFGEESK